MKCIFDKVDPQLESVSGLDCSLSVLLSQDGFSFLITHISSGKILRLVSCLFNSDDCRYNEPAGWPVHGNEYEKLFQKTDVFSQKYGRVFLAADSFKFTTAPYDFLINDSLSEIISASHEMRANEVSIVEPVFDLGPAIATLLPEYIGKICSKIFPDSILRSATTVFIKGVLRQNSQFITRQVFINMHNKYFEIAAIQGLRLQYLNAFRYSAPSDVLYYVVFILEQLGLVPSEQDIILMGDIAEDSVIIEQLKMYCASVHFTEIPAGIEFGETFKDHNLYRYFTLLNMHLCE